jgi:MFS family permease
VPTDIAAPTITAEAPAPGRSRSAIGALFWLTLTIVGAAAMRTALSPVQEIAEHALGLRDMDMSLIQGLFPSILIAIVALPLGLLIDRGNRSKLLIVLAIIWVAGELLTAFARNRETLIAARVLAGSASICVLPLLISLGADLSTSASRGRALGLIGFGQVLGGALAFIAGGAIYTWLGSPGAPQILNLEPWRGTQLIFGVVGAALILPLLFLREPARLEVGAASPSLGVVAKEMWARAGFLTPLYIGQIGVAMADTAAIVWAAPTLTRTFHQQPAQFAAWMGGTILLAGLIGTVLGGILADVGHKSKLRGGLIIGAVLASAVSIPAALFPIMPTVQLFGLAFGALLLTGFLSGLITGTAIAVLVPNELRGVCLGIFIVIGALMGGAGPVMVTTASDLMGGEAHLSLALAVSGAVIGAISFLGFLAAMFTAPRTMAA